MKYKWNCVYVLLLLLQDGQFLKRPNGRKQNTIKQPNVCREMKYYFSGATNDHECWYNPDVDSEAHDIIRRYGYHFESYKVTSQDGYITTLFRMRNKGNRPPVLLMHGLASSSQVMVDIGKKSLAGVLVDAGYEVWLGNLRGSSYSLGHVNMSYKENDYWNFSFHEMGKYDLLANLEFIFNKASNKQITFIGHSVATNAFHVFEALHRKSSKKLVKLAVLLSPTVYLSNIQSPQKEFDNLENPLMILANLLDIKTHSANAKEIDVHRKKLCQYIPKMFDACHNGLYLTFGLGSINIAPHFTPLMIAHNPSGFSPKTFTHLQQLSNSDEGFPMYDYGVAKNQKLYNSPFPPEYDVGGCEIPVVIFYGANDWISTEKFCIDLYTNSMLQDVQKFVSILPSDTVKQLYKIQSPVWKHMDYFYGKHLDKLFYQPLLESIKKFERPKNNLQFDVNKRMKRTETFDAETTEATTSDTKTTEGETTDVTAEPETTEVKTTELETTEVKTKTTDGESTDVTAEPETTEVKTTETETTEPETTNEETTATDTTMDRKTKKIEVTESVLTTEETPAEVKTTDVTEPESTESIKIIVISYPHEVHKKVKKYTRRKY